MPILPKSYYQVQQPAPIRSRIRMPFVVISKQHKCESCRKTYKRKHTCFGSSHRRPKALAQLKTASKPDGQICDQGHEGDYQKQSSSGNRFIAPPDLEMLSGEILVLPRNEMLSGGGHPDRTWPSGEPWISFNNIIGANYFTQNGVPLTSRVDFANSLPAPSNAAFLDINSQEWSFASAKQLLRLQARIAHRQSVLMRLKGDIKGSENTIKLFLSSLNTGSNDSAWCEELGALYLSQAMNHVYNFSFAESHREVRKWTPIADLPGGQERLLWDLILCVGRIMRGEGRFEEAKICFDTCLCTPGLRESKRFLVLSAVADLYCELAYLQMEKQAFYLSRAKAMVELEIERLRLSSGQHLKGFRRLLLSLVEVKIRQGYYWGADLLTRELITIYDNLQELDIVDRLGHVRALIAFARVAPSPEAALERWKYVLLWNRFYNPLEEEVFTCEHGMLPKRDASD
ncbi:hypothetical protein ACJ73_00066 [Blastomyces percursus]|uniref:Uncharacterized protein n=1 Tax=Blastomyces percursus TaxID=1658174 RepID=A0A1J9R832_9EURO|nr:hypothetical protein ACJ73_00066 [Blastomyces percursus]